MELQTCFEDLEVGQIDRFGAYPVTREEVIEFARKYDPLDFHIDESAAADNRIFGNLTASGVHTFAMTSRMIGDRRREAGPPVVAGLGMDEFRLLLPVVPGDTLSVESEVLSLRRSNSIEGVGIATMRLQTLNQHGQVVLRMQSVLLIPARETQGYGSLPD